MRTRAVGLAGALASVAVLPVVGCGGTEVADPVLVYAKPRYVLGNTGYEERGTIFVAKADGSDPRLLTNGIYPDLSPNGRWVAFSRPSGMYVVETRGGEPRLVARNLASGSWTPDSRSLVTSVGRSLAVTDIETGRRRIIARGRWPSISPSGKDIAWVRHERLARPIADLTFKEDVFRMAVHGDTPRRLTRTGDASTPVWGPRLIAYSRFQDDPLTAHFFSELWVMRPDGSGKRRLGRDRSIGPFAWSENGRRLLARYGGVASAAPAAADPITGDVQPIGRFGAEAHTTGFSRNGRFVLVWDRGDLVRIPWEGGARKVLVRNVDEVADWSL